MSDDYSVATAAATPVKIQGKQYLASKYTPRDFGDLNAWLKEQWPDPRFKARELCHGMSDAFALKVWEDLKREALLWPLTIESTEGNKLLTMTYEGNVQVLWVSLRRHNPGLSLDQVRKLALDVTIEEINEVIRKGFPEETWLPKDETATMTTPISRQESDAA